MPSGISHMWYIVCARREFRDGVSFWGRLMEDRDGSNIFPPRKPEYDRNTSLGAGLRFQPLPNVPSSTSGTRTSSNYVSSDTFDFET